MDVACVRPFAEISQSEKLTVWENFRKFWEFLIKNQCGFSLFTYISTIFRVFLHPLEITSFFYKNFWFREFSPSPAYAHGTPCRHTCRCTCSRNIRMTRNLRAVFVKLCLKMWNFLKFLIFFNTFMKHFLKILQRGAAATPPTPCWSRGDNFSGPKTKPTLLLW